jgi:hypothetical protein
MTSIQLLVELLKALVTGFLFGFVVALDVAGIHIFLTGRKDHTALDSAERRRLARWLWWPFAVFFVSWIVFRVYSLLNGEHIDLEHGL